MERVVFVGGVFDLFHVGHLNLLESASQLGNQLIVGVLTDEAAMKYKNKPVIPFKERKRIIEALKCVRQVVTLDDSDPTKYFETNQWTPDILVHGTDHTPDWEIGQTIVQAKGGVFVLLPYTEGISSTIIENRIKRRKK